MRVTIHSEALKFGQQPDPTAPELKDQLRDPDLVKDAEKNHIETIGYQLTYSQGRALHAVQLLLDETSYQGNAKPRMPKRGQRYHFQGTLPVLNIKTSDFLTTYGVKKLRTSRGKEFSPEARRVAINSLKDLGVDQHLLVYDKSAARATRNMWRVEAIAPLLALTWLNGARRVEIVPNPVLVDQLDSYFILKPENFYTLIPGKDPARVRFLEFLLYSAEMSRRDHLDDANAIWEIRLQMEKIAWRLRLDGLIRSRKKTNLRNKLNALYQFGVKVGYLDSFSVDQKVTKRRLVDILILNKVTFNYLVPTSAKPTSRKRKS